jgi:hypothetical protein
MNTIGVLLLAAATATGQLGGAHAGGKHWLRRHVVANGPAPPGGMIGGGGAGMGCSFGHPGCSGGQGCPGGGGGAGGAGQPGRRFPNVRSQVYFVDPPGMKIGWQTAAGGAERVYLPAQLTVPARYNFMQGYIYRLKITDIPGRNLTLYPTIEVAPSTPATDAYLTHNPIPAQFTEEDFDQVTAGNFVTKVIYLPDPKFQELAIAGVETLVSTRLEPGVDPILEADRRGTILMIVRLGAIDLEMPSTGVSVPANAAPRPTFAPEGAPGTVLPPGSLPPGSVPGAPGMVPGVPVDNAPVSPSPGPFTPTPAAPAPAPATTPDAQPPVPSPEPPAAQPAAPGAEAPVPVPNPN